MSADPLPTPAGMRDVSEPHHERRGGGERSLALKSSEPSNEGLVTVFTDFLAESDSYLIVEGKGFPVVVLRDPHPDRARQFPDGLIGIKLWRELLAATHGLPHQPALHGHAHQLTLISHVL